MKNVLGWLLWIAIFLALLVGMDHFLMGPRSEAPVVREVQEFYQDFRQRLATIPGVGNIEMEDGVTKVIENSRSSAPHDDFTTLPDGEPKFLYVDSGGKLHFASSLEEIPPPYREEAQPLEQ